MEDVANYVDRIIAMNDAKVYMDGTVKEVFSRVDELEAIHLGVPEVTYLMREIKGRGFDVDETVTTVEEAKREILKLKGMLA
jgi:energy-coupling factor transport system ATP-binding protein